MHEFAIAQDIISSLKTSLKDDMRDITAIDIEIGAFSGIVTDSLSFGLETIFAENDIANVRINIKKCKAEATCKCGNKYVISDIFELCPKCGSASRDISSGTEILVKSVNLRDKENE